MKNEKPDEITLRDYFAALAMQALVNDLYATHVGNEREDTMVAEISYSVADAMIKVRENNNEQ